MLECNSQALVFVLSKWLKINTYMLVHIVFFFFYCCNCYTQFLIRLTLNQGSSFFLDNVINYKHTGNQILVEVLKTVVRSFKCCNVYVTLTLQHVYFQGYKRLRICDKCSKKVFILVWNYQDLLSECKWANQAYF